MFLIKIGVVFPPAYNTNAFKMKYFIPTSAGREFKKITTQNKKQGKSESSLLGNFVIWRGKMEILLWETSPHWSEICPASGGKFCPACKEITIFPRLPICTQIMLSLIYPGYPPKCYNCNYGICILLSASFCQYWSIASSPPPPLMTQYLQHSIKCV